MKKSSIVASLVLVILVVAAAVLVTHKMDTNKNASSASGSTTTSSASATQSSQGTVTGHIEITNNMIFTPSQITVHKGEAVMWTNNDDKTHTVTDDLSNVGGPNSGNIAPGATYSFTFNKTGSFQYHCEIHHEMRGTIVVK